MRRLRAVTALVVVAPWLVSAGAGAPTDDYDAKIKPLIERYCYPCHTDAGAAAGLSLQGYGSLAAIVADRHVWESVHERVDKGLMPPPGARRMRDADRELLLGWLHEKLYQVDCEAPLNPGRVTIRRLNRTEYDHTIRDLFGLKFHPAEDFPYDDVGYGFDNIGDVLSMPVLLMEKYLEAAEQITERAIVSRPAEGERQRIEVEAIDEDAEGSNPDGNVRVFFSNGVIGRRVTTTDGGRYAFRARAWGAQAGPDPCRLSFRLNGREVALVDVPETAAAPATKEVFVDLAPGAHRLEVAFVNDYYNPEAADENQRDRNLLVDWFELQGPIETGPRRLPTAHTRIITARPAEDTEVAWRQAAREVLAPFGRRCWRRPPTDAELDKLAGVVLLARADGDTFERGVQLALQAMLISPHFLYRVELDQADTDQLGHHAIASRLSYFLWASMPDDPLLDLADAGRLHDPRVIAAQVKRMLADPKAVALTESFAAQWLQLRRLDDVSPDPARFPGFDDELRRAMRTETELFFANVVKDDRSVLDFLSGRYSYLNERLAAHYGVPGVKGAHFRRVEFTGDLARRRQGVLTQASVLTVTSNPTRTSPVKRGKYVLETILGAPQPDPPPGVPPLGEDQQAILSGTLRQRTEQHREDPNCAVCHIEMDAIGFGFENYDAVGAWRTKDGEFDIDPSGELPGGRKFADGGELRWLLAQRRDEFVRCLAEKLLTYALGRGLEYYDACTIDAVVEAAAKQDYRFSALATAVATSDPFLRRGADRRDPQ